MKDETAEIKKLIDQLKEAEKTDMVIATSMRTKNPASSMFWFKMAELMKTAAEMLEKTMPAEAELEGGDKAYWYVCGKCHAMLKEQDVFCAQCGRRIMWG